MKRIAFIGIALLLPLLMSGQTAEECFEKGIKSYESKDYAEAYKWFKQAADQGNAKGQNGLGILYERGHGITKDITEAIKWYKLSAEQGYASAQNNLGLKYANGIGVEKDYAEAFKWYQKAVEQGNAQAQNNLGDLFFYGNGVTKDYNEALKWYRNAAERDDATGQANLGYMYEYGYGVDKDNAEALKWYYKAAEQNNLWSMNQIGLLYANGRGVEKDYAEAVKWYLKSAEQGNARAQNNLGDMYLKGNGVTKDYNEALKWFRKSAEQNYATGQVNLGNMYELGYGVDKDYAEAAKWYQKAAEQGNSKAQYNLGGLFRDGLGVIQDYSEAVKWYRKATDQGNLNAQVSLGWMYENGYGVAKDVTEAVKQYSSAAENGNPTAQSNMGVIYEFGIGVEKDYKEAIRWYRKAIENGSISGMSNIGRMYEDGKGVRKSYIIAMDWYQKAAEHGYSEAMRWIGSLYEDGKGVSKNYLIAVEWYKKAIENAPTYGNDLSDAKKSLARIQQKIANEPKDSKLLKVTDELAKIRQKDKARQQTVEVKQITQQTTSTAKETPKFPIIDYVENSLAFVDPSGGNIIKTNGNYKIQFQIQNSGSGEAKGCKVKVSASGDVKDINFKDLMLNTIAPKETMTVEIPISSGANISNGQVEFTVQVDEPNGFGTDPQYIAVTTRGFEAPLVKIADYSLTGSNGKMLKKKQPFDLQLMLQNTKYGQADNVTVNVELPQNVIQVEGDDLNKSFPKLAGGESKSLEYSLIVNNNYSGTIIPIKIHLKEKYGKYAEDRTISLNLEQDFAKAKLVVTENKDVRPALEKLDAGSDVDKDIPQAKERQENTFALIITNEDYKIERDVPCAYNDGEIFMAYCKEALGIPEENFIYRQDATFGDFHTVIKNIKEISTIKNGDVNVIFYYAGHGIPNNQGKAYLLPSDGDSKIPDVCFPLERLYQELGEMNAKRVLVFMDACFSGANLNETRGMAIKIKNPHLKGNMVVFSAASGDEAASPYKNQGHGLFTYYLLKKLKESDGNCTLGELGRYLQENVGLTSIRLNQKRQTPTVESSDALSSTWQQMRLK